jgi:kynurenine formamidase
VPRLLGLDWLEPGTAILPEDLDAAAQAAGLEVRPGDVLLVRTGRHARRAALGPWALADHSAGLHASVGRWLGGRGIVALGGDGFSEVIPSGVEGMVEPMHALTLVAMGTYLLDNLYLEALAAACAGARRWEFLFSAAPLRLPGATGSPLNPIAVL